MKRYLFALLLVGCAGATEPPAADAKNPVVVMKTSAGTIKIELFEDKAPITVKNFLAYVDDKHYDGTIFHRVIPTFMIQGGGFKKGLNKVANAPDTKNYEKKTKAAIKNEADNGVKNDRGTLAMARTNDPDSATSQFFINVKSNPDLNKSGRSAGYAVFGKVIEGMDVVDKIKAVKTGSLANGFDDVPTEDVVIESVTREGK